MRVLVDATPVLLPSAGVKNYIYYWLRHLQAEAQEHSIRAFPALRELGHLDHVQSTLGRFPTLARLALVNFSNIRGNRALDILLGGGYDVFHASQHLVNPPRRRKLTATIYDMTCWLIPEMHTPANVTATRRYGERVLGRADGLIAISESARNDAVRILGLREEIIQVIYPGVSQAFFHPPKSAIERVRHIYGLEKPYLLFVGCIEPRKNLEGVLDAWEALPPAVRRDFECVVAGPLGWSSDRIGARLHCPGTGVRYLGYIVEENLPAVMAGAAVLLYPSYYEGFGFPVVQAMAAGTPVVTSNGSSLAEIAGDAALLVNPRCKGEIADAVRQILFSPGLAEELRARGVQRAEQYQWQGCARKSLQFFQRIVNA
jgi:glycosyltransferase involved in cell wall biosynthesis